MNLNDKNLNALSYKVKALIALEKHNDALTYIKQSLSIKYNKTLYKYLVDIENKMNIYKPEKSEQMQMINLRNEKKEKKICVKQEYKKIFLTTNNSLFYLNEEENNYKSELTYDLNEETSEINNKKNEEGKICLLSYYKKMLLRFIYLFFKIIIRHFLRHKSLYSILATLIALYKRRDVIKIISFLINYLGRLMIDQRNWNKGYNLNYLNYLFLLLVIFKYYKKMKIKINIFFKNNIYIKYIIK